MVCVASTRAGFESSGGWQQAASSGWDTTQSGWASASSGWESGQLSSGWQQAAPLSSGWDAASVSSGWETAAPASSGWQAPTPQQEKKIVIIKQQQNQGHASPSLTVAGPTHVIKTVHQVRTIDQGGKILHKSADAQAKVLLVKSVATAEVKHAQPQGWPQKVQAGWQSASSGW